MRREARIPQTKESRLSRVAEQTHKKIAHWSFAEYQIKLLKFAYKFPAVLPRGSGRHQAPPVLSQGRSASFHQCKGPAALVRDSTLPALRPPTLYSSKLGRERSIGKSHHRYDDGCHFWTLSLIKALPGALYNHP